MPVPNTYRYALEHADLDACTAAIRAWLAANGIDWAGAVIRSDGKAQAGAGTRGTPISTAAAFVGRHRALVALAAHAGDERDAARRSHRSTCAVASSPATPATPIWRRPA